MFIQVFISTLISSGLAWDPHVSTSNVHPSAPGSFIRSIGDFKHQEANVVDKFINKIQHRDDGKHTAPGDVIRAFGDFKYRVADAADDVVDSVQIKVEKGKSFLGDILDGFFQKKPLASEHHSFQPSSLSSSFSPSIESGVYPVPPEFPSVSVDGSVSGILDRDNTLYPYPNIKKPVSPRFVFIYDKGQRDLTFDDIIDVGKYLEGVKKIAANNKVNF
ncbi:uncharacterized protein LOC123263234 [Cotesia glomerata]|uniref:uncharacterized protein LOC123263234 n=1 Tax=Cotesia glomerata TaxID=32391 RepID=UPI001D02860F|nr:uncharacterized protein LOC123263234 [Cotesia glomerata]